MAGETGPPPLSMPKAMLMAGFFAIAFYNTIEIFILIFSTFKKRRGRYFWSMVVAAIGIPTHAIAFLLRYYGLAPNLPMSAFTIVGWCFMVTGQSVVLWSRLHLVVHDPTRIRLVLVMIITNACFLHIPESVIFVLCNMGNPEPYIFPFHIYERVEIVAFSVQESIISGLFLWEGFHSFKPVLFLRAAEGRSLLRQLVVLFLLNVLLDSSLIVLEYTNYFDIETTCKPFVYSVKLKAEFIILNRLRAFTRKTCGSRFLDSSPVHDVTNSKSTSSAMQTDRIAILSLEIGQTDVRGERIYT
ncbi:integral membrane protein [Fusarium beomiforme]|uniref:Integral membrane protein n=1 Tax=Fusarium beomiforme TaxID=44412 RepID=A0A9P5A3G7_9HYPO|nr:integral membrane protein [Fusarium beomiforme]